MAKDKLVTTKMQGTVRTRPLRKLVSDGSWVALMEVYVSVGGTRKDLGW